MTQSLPLLDVDILTVTYRRICLVKIGRRTQTLGSNEIVTVPLDYQKDVYDLI